MQALDSLTNSINMKTKIGKNNQGQVATDYKMTVNDVNFWYGNNKVLHDVSLNLNKNKVTALIGPSGCGKSTFLRTLNRMNDTIPGIACGMIILLIV